MKKERWQIYLIGFLCFVISASICVQYRTIEKYTKKSEVSGQSMTEKKLRDKVFKEQEIKDRLQKQVDDKKDELANVIKESTASNEELQSLEQELSELNRVIGYTDVVGKGLQITLQDADPNDLGYTNDNLVHDLDLVEIVNELFNAGAEAVAINDQRVVSTTSINCNGNVVRINNEKISVPFTIKAIGSPEGLYGTMTRPGGYLSLMKNGSIKIQVDKKEEITVPKFSGTIQFQYLEIAE